MYQVETGVVVSGGEVHTTLSARDRNVCLQILPRSQVSDVYRPGDWVVPLAPATGTWRERGRFPAAAFHRIAPGSIPLEAAAMLTIK